MKMKHSIRRRVVKSQFAETLLMLELMMNVVTEVALMFAALISVLRMKFAGSRVDFSKFVLELISMRPLSTGTLLSLILSVRLNYEKFTKI